jgi:hypothetical protein
MAIKANMLMMAMTTINSIKVTPRCVFKGFLSVAQGDVGPLSFLSAPACWQWHRRPRLLAHGHRTDLRLPFHYRHILSIHFTRETNMTFPVRSYAAHAPNGRLGLFHVERRSPRADDVVIEILFCGVCHSDLHNVRNDWGNAQYPMVPGHEIIGRVVEVGALVTRFKAGDKVGVGCMVDSCQHCGACGKGWEQYCENGSTFTYNGTDRVDGSRTHGGYSERVVVKQDFVLRVPDGLDLAGAAPLLCAGITTYSPLRNWKVAAGSKVAIVGLGGLGHMGLKLDKAMGAASVALPKHRRCWTSAASTASPPTSRCCVSRTSMRPMRVCSRPM